MNSDFSGSDIQQGMDVFDSTGQKIGSVSDVYQNTGSGGIGGSGSWGNDAGVGDVIVEEIDIVTTPDYGTGTSDTGTGSGSTDTSNFGTRPGDTSPTDFNTTSTAGFGSGSSSSNIGSGTTGSSDMSTSPAGAGIGTMASTGYFKVSEGGVLGIGATDLYIPFSAVAGVTDNQINLNCTKDQAEQQYQQKPAFIDNIDNS